MVLIKNNLRKIKLDQAKIIAYTKKILHILGYENFDITILLTTNTTIRRYNKQFRKKDKATDILSFPYYPELKPGQQIKAPSNEEKNLGDLIISLEYVQQEAPKWKQTPEQRIRILLVHGICHLLGYDHIKDNDYKVMRRKENQLLAKL